MNNEFIEVNYIAEKDMDFIIIEEFVSSREFSNIFTKKINLFDYKVLKAVHSMVDVTYGESDIVLVLETENGNVGILIENKIDAIAMPEQYDRYEKRALKLIEQGIFSSYHIFIVAPYLYLKTNYEASKYPNQTSYEEILDYFTNREEPRFRFKEVVVKNAITKKRNGYTPIEDEAVTLFWQEYYNFKNEHFPHLILNEVKGPRGANATWPWFDTKFKYVRIAHKTDRGFVDLTLGRMGNYLSEIKAYLSNKLREDMTVVKTNKSISVRIRVPEIDFKKSFASYIDEMIICLQAVDTLYDLLVNIDIKKIYDDLL